MLALPITVQVLVLAATWLVAVLDRMLVDKVLGRTTESNRWTVKRLIKWERGINRKTPSHLEQLQAHISICAWMHALITVSLGTLALAPTWAHLLLARPESTTGTMDLLFGLSTLVPIWIAGKSVLNAGRRGQQVMLELKTHSPATQKMEDEIDDAKPPADRKAPAGKRFATTLAKLADTLAKLPLHSFHQLMDDCPHHTARIARKMTMLLDEEAGTGVRESEAEHSLPGASRMIVSPIEIYAERQLGIPVSSPDDALRHVVTEIAGSKRTPDADYSGLPSWPDVLSAIDLIKAGRGGYTRRAKHSKDDSLGRHRELHFHIRVRPAHKPDDQDSYYLCIPATDLDRRYHIEEGPDGNVTKSIGEAFLVSREALETLESVLRGNTVVKRKFAKLQGSDNGQGTTLDRSSFVRKEIRRSWWGQRQFIIALRREANS